MFDKIQIDYEGSTFRGRRFLRSSEGKTYQTVFYGDRVRCDPAGYAQFTETDTVMNAAAGGLLEEMVRAEIAYHMELRRVTG